MVQQFPGFVAVQNPDGTTTYQPVTPPAQQPPAPPPGYGAPPGYGPPPGYPPAPAPQAYPPPGYAPPAPAPVQHPHAQGFYQPTYPAPGYPQAAPPMPGPPPGYGAPPPSAAPPTFYIPSQEEAQAAYARAREEQARVAAQRAGGGGSRKGVRNVKFLGPNGEKRWNAAVPVGFERHLLLRFLPSPIQGVSYVHEGPKHSVWADGKSLQGWCAGPSCRVCAEVEVLLGQAGDNRQAWTKANGAKAKLSRLYQVLQYGSLALTPGGWVLASQDAQLHRDENGRVRPLILEASSTLYAHLAEIFNTRTLVAILDLERGTPLKVTKKKDGVEEKNISYTAMDLTQFAGALPREFGFGPRGEGLELHDLRKIAAPMDTAAQELMIQKLRGGAPQAPQQYSYSPNPQAPQSPYPQQPQSAWQPPQALPSVAPQTPPAYQGPPQPQGGWAPPPPPPVLPTTGQPLPGSYTAAAPKPGDPWAENFPGPADGPPPGWVPPAPPATPPAWGAPPASAPSPELQSLQAQMMGTQPAPAYPAPPVGAPPQHAAGPGPAYPPPPVGAPPPK